MLTQLPLSSLGFLHKPPSSYTFLPSLLPQQLINAAPLFSIIRATIFLLSHPTQPDSNPSMHPMHN
jgi:hypothetical protein